MPNLNITYFNKGFNFSQDGPGNRLVYHMYGCNFRCPWCSNPECFAADTKTVTQAISEIENEIMRSRSMFFGGGGVTFTGGEPTLQFEALLKLLVELKRQGINTALECNASHRRLPELFPYIDHLMLDIKHPFDDEHARITEHGNVKTVENIILAGNTRQLALRIPIVEGYNTSDECIEGFIKIIKRIKGNNFTLELLPYHEYGRVKWQQHGMDYKIENGFVSESRLKSIRKMFEDAGINLIKT